jgi:Flp pilus assembly protein TadG
VSTRRGRTDGGAAAVEFALILIPMLVILFGLIQYGLYFYSAQTGSNTVNAAVRQLAVGNCQSDASLQTYVDNQLGAARTGAATIKRDYKNPDGTTPPAPAPVNVGIGGTVTLTISFHTMNMHFPLVPFLSDSWVDRRVQARLEDTTEQGCGA